jgi:hypothetical protein
MVTWRDRQIDPAIIEIGGWIVAPAVIGTKRTEVNSTLWPGEPICPIKAFEKTEFSFRRREIALPLVVAETSGAYRTKDDRGTDLDPAAGRSIRARPGEAADC